MPFTTTQDKDTCPHCGGQMNRYITKLYILTKWLVTMRCQVCDFTNVHLETEYMTQAQYEANYAVYRKSS